MEKTIKVLVDTNALIKFFEEDSAWGTSDKPLIADDFCTVEAPDIQWEGNKILPLEAATDYVISVESSSEEYPVVLYDSTTGTINGEIDMDMITPTITKLEEWEKVFDLDSTNYVLSLDGHLVLKPTTDNVFSLATPDTITLHHNIFYKILFKIGEADKMAIIDPFIFNRTTD
jgi:hypothetical protein